MSDVLEGLKSADPQQDSVYTTKSAQFEKKRVENVEQRLRSLLAELDLKNKEISQLKLQLKRAQSNSTCYGAGNKEVQGFGTSMGKTYVKGSEKQTLKGIKPDNNLLNWFEIDFVKLKWWFWSRQNGKWSEKASVLGHEIVLY